MLNPEFIIEQIEKLSTRERLLIVLFSQLLYFTLIPILYPNYSQVSTFLIVLPAIVSAHLLSSTQTLLSVTISLIYTYIYLFFSSNIKQFSNSKFFLGITLTYLLSFFINQLIEFTKRYYYEAKIREKFEQDLLKKNEELKIYAERLEAEIIEKHNTERTLRKSEEQYRQLVEKANIGILMDDVHGNIKFFNEQFCSISGYSPNELINLNLRDLIHEDDYPKVLEKHRSRFEGIVPYERYEVRLKRKDQNIIFVEVDVSAIAEKNKIIGTKAYLWDITTRKITELALKESEERFRSIYNNATMGFYRMTSDGRIVMANPKFFEMLKINANELLNKKLQDVLETDEKRDNFINLIRKERKVNGYESEWYRKDGALFFGRETAWTIDDESGDIAYIDVILEDITLKKQIEEEREQLISLLQSAKTEIKVLSGLLPICASCKRIRDEDGSWHNVEHYITEHSAAEFSHGLCPDCAQKLYPSAYK